MVLEIGTCVQSFLQSGHSAGSAGSFATCQIFTFATLLTQLVRGENQLITAIRASDIEHGCWQNGQSLHNKAGLLTGIKLLS